MLLACACTSFWCCNITCSVVGYRRLVCRAVVPMMREVVMIETLMGMSFQHPALFLILTVVLLQQRLLSASLCHRHLLHSAAFRPMTLWNRVPHQNVVLRQLHMMMLGPPPSYLLVPPVARHCYDLYLVMCCRISLYVYLCEFAGLCLIVFFDSQTTTTASIYVSCKYLNCLSSLVLFWNEQRKKTKGTTCQSYSYNGHFKVNLAGNPLRFYSSAHSRREPLGTSSLGFLETRCPSCVKALKFCQLMYMYACSYTVSQKKQDTKLLPITLPNIGRFSKFFHC